MDDIVCCVLVCLCLVIDLNLFRSSDDLIIRGKRGLCRRLLLLAKPVAGYFVVWMVFYYPFDSRKTEVIIYLTCTAYLDEKRPEVGDGRNEGENHKPVCTLRRFALFY